MDGLHKDNLIHKEIPVMMYHRVVKKTQKRSRFHVFTTQDVLEGQIKSFLAEGYKLVTFKDLQNKYVDKPMILTFDDGYLDNYENLFPLLKKYGIKAVIFVLADSQYNHWDTSKGEVKAELMNHQQILELSKSGLVEIASHGLKHRRLPLLNDAELRAEITQSKKIIEEIIQDKVISFAYPWGLHGNREKFAVKNAGYKFGVATDGGSNFFKDDLFGIRRINMNKASLWQRIARRFHWILTS